MISSRAGIESGSYRYKSSAVGHTHAYLQPHLDKLLRSIGPERVFELGCGNGNIAASMRSLGCDVTAIDLSETGIATARSSFPGIRFEVASAYDDLAAAFGTFPMVVCLDVIEHLYFPKTCAARIFEMLEPGGRAVISTPYHGYLKNIALAVTGKMDAHFTALWDGGHIKFFSASTLRKLLAEQGFVDIRISRIGRIPTLAKSMVAVAQRPM